MRERLVAINRRNVADARAGTITRADGIVEIPASHYVDPDRWRLEVDRIFKRVPLVAGFSGELPGPGTYKACEMVDVPVLLSRGRDGQVRAFVNMCSHRGAQVMEEGTGKARSFSCPYHAWTYNLEGDLVAVFDDADFGDLDLSCHGLTALPVLERAGFIWVMLRPDPVIDFDTWLAGFDEVLACHDLADAHHVGRQVLTGPNWKICYDGYLDLYHLPILHKNSFGPNFPNKAKYDAWGPHQQVSGPSTQLEDLVDLPDDEWPHSALAQGLATIFPHVSVAGGATRDPSVMISQLFPGADVGSSYTVQNFLVRDEPTDEIMAGIEESMAFLHHVVQDEDYATCDGIQRTLRTGAKDTIMFGRNEGGGQNFHAWVDRLIAADDEDLPGLFA